MTVTALGGTGLEYSYTLSGPTSGTEVVESFQLQVVDLDGDQVNDVLTISIIDDEPVALDDNRALAALPEASESGNVLTGAGNGDARDVAGADSAGFTITALRTGEESDSTGTTQGVIGVGLQGMYGFLTLGADGAYTYTLTADLVGLDSGETVYDVFTYTVSDGDGSTDSAQLTVTINPLNDQPTITAEYDPIEITTANVNNTDEDFLVSAFDLSGDPAAISINGQPVGFGVAGTASGANTELGQSGGDSESLVVSFDTPVYGAEVSFSWMNPREGASFTFLRDGEVVGTGEHRGGSNRVDPAITLAPDNGEAFDEIVFTAPGRGDDYLIYSIVASTVYEAGLECGSGEGPVTTRASGTFQVGDPDGLDDIESVAINGVVVSVAALTAGTVSIAGASGTLLVETYDPASGSATYVYTLEQPLEHGAGPAVEEFTFTVSDGDTTATSTVQIDIVEDPAAPAVQIDAAEDCDAPVVVDLDNDGIDYFALDAGVRFVDESTSVVKQTAWVAPEDALLVIDADGSGTVNTAQEYVFTEWSDTAETDLAAIAEVFDSNQDGVLDAEDERFEEFALWQDANSNGVTDAGELFALSELGVDAIALTYSDDSEAGSAAGGDVTIFGESEIRFKDGSTSTVHDTSFSIEMHDMLSGDNELILPIFEEHSGLLEQPVDSVQLSGAGHQAAMIALDMPVALNLQDEAATDFSY
ncbi:hypothetical protein A3709_02235 [Halioglobus sp. HI00S01]|uniref:VCBS domain-containing protein n=1 Tax=Halioglobus sp. HI00S01 TaxID=1822214 RepID=UPI0007C27F20|nr:VCBS domain-containing protein [Halioglobus sp. HI00S01]KZX58303.1 hypothetical protein A3709_02235 [Halioglobus sp. HI00S01]